MSRVPHYRTPDACLLYNLGDVHRGDEACDVPLFERVIGQIEREKHARWVSTGDLLNCALAGGKSSSYTSASVQEELEALTENLKPIAAKCLGFVASNHHGRMDRAVGMSLDKVLAQYLGVPYLGKRGRIAITCNRLSYWIALHHLCGGGATMGAKANKMERLTQWMPGFDVYLGGHTHTFSVSEDVTEVPDRKRYIMRPLRSLKTVTGHFLDYDKSYAADMMLPEKPKGAVAVTLDASPSGNERHKKMLAALMN